MSREKLIEFLVKLQGLMQEYDIAFWSNASADDDSNIQAWIDIYNAKKLIGTAEDITVGDIQHFIDNKPFPSIKIK
jgi:hypothetical protein